VADRIVVLRLGKNNGIFYPDASNQELVSAITGASDNSVSRRAQRLAAASPSPSAEGGPRMTPETRNPSTPPLMDRADERLKDESGLAGSVRAFIIDCGRSGDLGSLPVIVGLIAISIIFQSINPVFLSANNLVNILFDCSTIGVISLGIVCILMLGEIDLSVGSVSGFASALLGVLWVNQGWPLAGAVVAALAVEQRSEWCTPSCSIASACRASCRRWLACSPYLACNSTYWAAQGRSTCPLIRRLCASARSW
jgi:hypothetical protein